MTGNREFADCRNCAEIGQHTRTAGCIIAVELAQAANEEAGFKVWRVTYEPVDDVIHPTAGAALIARSELSKADPAHSYVIQHASITTGPTS